MRRSSRAGDFAEDFTIRSTFFAKYSPAAAAESQATSSKHFLVEWPAARTGSAVPICDTTCRSRSRKPPSAPKRKSKCKSSIFATNAKAQAPKADRGRLIVPFAAVAARSSAHVDFSRCRRLVRDAAGLVRWSKNRAVNAKATVAWKRRVELNSKFPLELPTVLGCVHRATVRLEFAADRREIYTSSFTSRSTRFSSATKTICIAKCQFHSPWPRLAEKCPCRHWKAKRISKSRPELRVLKCSSSAAKALST